MCTAITYKSKHHYFGRNLDLEYTYDEAVVITPRNYRFKFKEKEALTSHFAMIGVATVIDGYPLYYDATNEMGLSIAGLNFVGNAQYYPRREGADNLAPYELIPWILGTCRDIKDAKESLGAVNLIDTPFRNDLPTAKLHWLVADKNGSFAVETTKDGMKIYNDPVGVLTNNPPFPFHLQNLTQYLHLTSREAENRLSKEIELTPYSKGFGAFGIPGDLSSPSRFVRASFVKLNSITPENEGESVSQFFHILGSVEQQEGAVQSQDGFERTQYTSCCNIDKGIYYYKTYSNNRITAVSLFKEELDSERLYSFKLITEQDVKYQNG